MRLQQTFKFWFGSPALRRVKAKLMAAADDRYRLSLDADRAQQKGRKMAVPVMNGSLGMNGGLGRSLGRTAGARLVEPCYSGGRLTSRRLALGFGFGPRPPSAAIAVVTRRGAVL
jgi:hypothetical protein